MKIEIEIEDTGFYAEIQVDDGVRHWVELSGSYWLLRRVGQGAFARPLKRWKSTCGVKDIVAKMLAYVLTTDCGQLVDQV